MKNKGKYVKKIQMPVILVHNPRIQDKHHPFSLYFWQQKYAKLLKANKLALLLSNVVSVLSGR